MPLTRRMTRTLFGAAVLMVFIAAAAVGALGWVLFKAQADAAQKTPHVIAAVSAIVTSLVVVVMVLLVAVKNKKEARGRG